MDLSIALEALQQDAGRWHDLSGVLSGAGTAASGLTVTDTAMSWAAVDSGLYDTYTSAVTRISDLLAQGGDESDLIGDTLVEVRAAYVASEERARSTFAGMWAPRE
jgi:hypothetical protein